MARFIDELWETVTSPNSRHHTAVLKAMFQIITQRYSY